MAGAFRASFEEAPGEGAPGEELLGEEAPGGWERALWDGARGEKSDDRSDRGRRGGTRAKCASAMVALGSCSDNASGRGR